VCLPAARRAPLHRLRQVHRLQGSRLRVMHACEHELARDAICTTSYHLAIAHVTGHSVI
jgi:hypothetical protein